MEPELLKKEELGAYLSMDGDLARQLCKRHGVLPINVGLGKVSRLRWRRSDVMLMLDTMSADKQPARRRRKKSDTVEGKSMRQLISELARPAQ